MLKKNRKSKILIILSIWPSKLSPYLTLLYSKLLDKFENVEFFMFQKGDDPNALNLTGSVTLSRVYTKTYFRPNPFSFTNYLKASASIFKNLKSSVHLYKCSLRERGKIHRALGQLFYNHNLLGRKYDLIYINALQSARHFCLKGLFPETPILVSSRGQDFDFEPDGFDEVLKQIDHLHVLGEYLKQKAVLKGFLPEKITIIPPAAISSSGHVGRNISVGNEIIIVSAARLAWTKGYTYALRAISMAISQLPGYKVRYHILGDGPEKEFLQVEAVRLGIQDHVIFHGWQPQQEVNNIVAQADIYLLLSIVEGFNNSVLQAQNLGIPCIVADTGGLPENVVDGVTGYVVPRYDAETAAEKVLHLVRHPELRHQMGDAAKRRVNEHFTLDKQVTRYVEMFEQVMQNHADTVRV